jgi:hypothetical protein
LAASRPKPALARAVIAHSETGLLWSRTLRKYTREFFSLPHRAAAFISGTPWIYSFCSPFRRLSEETLSARIASLSFEEATTWQAYHDRYFLSDAIGYGHRFERVAELVGGCPDVETLTDIAGAEKIAAPCRSCWRGGTQA